MDRRHDHLVGSVLKYVLMTPQERCSAHSPQQPMACCRFKHFYSVLRAAMHSLKFSHTLMQTHSYKHGAQKQLVVKKHVILTDIN